jgi:putative transposase
MLGEAEILQSQGLTIGEISRKLGITGQTYFRWRIEYGGTRVDQAQRLKELKKENLRLKKLVADLMTDTVIDIRAWFLAEPAGRIFLRSPTPFSIRGEYKSQREGMSTRSRLGLSVHRERNAPGTATAGSCIFRSARRTTER